MTGLAVLERVRACPRLADLAACLLPGRDDGPSVAAARALGARGYRVKPFRNGTLLEIVQGMPGSLDRDGAALLPGNLVRGR